MSHLLRYPSQRLACADHHARVGVAGLVGAAVPDARAFQCVGPQSFAYCLVACPWFAGAGVDEHAAAGVQVAHGFLCFEGFQRPG